MRDAAGAGPGLSPPADSRRFSQAPAEPPQPRPQEGPSDGTNGTRSPASAPSGSNHSTPGPQPLLLPLPLPASAPALASAPPPRPGPMPRSQASSPRLTPVPGPVSTGTPPEAGPYQSHHGHYPPPPPSVMHYQQAAPPPAHHGHQQPLLMNRGYPHQPSPVQQGRVAIVEPPGAGFRASGPNVNGLRSPGRDHARANPKFNEDISRLTHAIQQSLPEAVRHATREHWEKTLLGSDYHQNFVVSLGFFFSPNANGLATTRSQAISLSTDLLIFLPAAACCDILAPPTPPLYFSSPSQTLPPRPTSVGLYSCGCYLSRRL